MMNCNTAEKNLGSLIRGTLKGNELRRTYYHIKKCPMCYELLLDEFSFYTSFNDLDVDLDFNYKKNLNKLLDDIGYNLKKYDAHLKNKYILYSILFCVASIVVVAIAVRFVF